MGKNVCAPSNVHTQEAAAIVQHSPCSSAAGRGPWIVWFCPYYKTTFLKAPPITFWFFSPTNNMIQKILQSCFGRYLLHQLSLSAFQPILAQSPHGHRHRVQGSWGTPVKKLCQEGKGALQMIQVPAPLQPATAGYLTTMGKAIWKASQTSCLWGQGDKQQGHKNTDLSCWSCQQGCILH